jgi:Uma2 family endonuclease
MSVAEIINYTYEDYKRWEGDWELIDGMPIAMAPAPMKTDQNISGAIYRELADSLDICDECEALYEVDWKIAEDTILRPDILISCHDEDKNYITKSPKLIVEVISPSTAKKDEKIKYEIYEKEGVDYYILVYPDDLKAKIFRLKDDKYVKVGDYTKELFTSQNLECDVSIDFERVFRKFR